MHKILKKCISLVSLNSITTWLSALDSGARIEFCLMKTTQIEVVEVAKI
jgi:hypothetical protein